MPGHTKCCTCQAKSSSQNRRSDASKCNPSQDLWRTCLLYCASPGKCILPDPRQMPHACHHFWKCYKTVTFCSLLTRAQSLAPAPRNDIWTSKSAPSMVWFVHFNLEICFALQRCALVRHLNFQKCSEHGVIWCDLYILTWKFASRYSGVHFFDISTSKSVPSMVWFVHFDLDMCFAPQRRALFRHLNFQKCSEQGMFCTFWLGNVLRATAACTFSTSQLPKVLRGWRALYILTSKCASHHNGAQFFTSHLPRRLRTRRFGEVTFRPSEATNHWKNTVLTLLPFRAPASSFFSLFLFSDLLSSALLLSDSSHLCFSICHIVGSLTSKLPSILGSESLFVVILVVVRISWVFPKRSIRQNGRTGL